MNKRNKLYLSLLIFTLASIFSSCGKEEEQLVVWLRILLE